MPVNLNNLNISLDKCWRARKTGILERAKVEWVWEGEKALQAAF